ncbi:MAG: ABC transporter ATP-binding protein [Planctomycetota bacterium]
MSTPASSSVRVAAGQPAVPVIACQRLSKTFRDFWMRPRVRAVEDLTFEIAPREVFGLLGPNGSGKSTTIKMILGLLHPSKGRLLVFGKSPSDVAIKSRIGYLPEESYLYPFLNARETLEYYAKLFEIPAKTRRQRIDELLEMVGLSTAQHRPVREYSKGMQRRIGLAQALINDPDFLILDEPTTGLDPIGTRQVKDLIVELGRRGKTILLSSHLLADVEDVVDRMIILYGGKKRDEGTTDQLLTKTSVTTIETDALDEDTITEIDRVIRERSGGAQSIRSVAHPRQKLEEKFLDIVEQAKRERLDTSGAVGDGKTAAFLAAETGRPVKESPDEVLSRLMTQDEPAEHGAVGSNEAQPAEAAAGGVSVPLDANEPQSSQTAADAAAKDEILAGLLRDDATAPAPAAPSRGEPADSPAAAHEAAQEASASSGAPSSSDVDRGMIDSLLGAGDEQQDRTKEHGT